MGDVTYKSITSSGIYRLFVIALHFKCDNNLLVANKGSKSVNEIVRVCINKNILREFALLMIIVNYTPRSGFLIGI